MQKLVFVAIIISLISTVLLSTSFGEDWISPKQQVELRVLPGYVKCNVGLTLILKLVDYSPACVKPETFTKLIERGWGSDSLKMQQPIKTLRVSGSESFMDYSIGGGEVREVYLAPRGSSDYIRISLETTSDGEMTVKFPRFKVGEGCESDHMGFLIFLYDLKKQVPYEYMESPIAHYLAFKFLNGTEEILLYGNTSCHGDPVGVDLALP